MRQSPWIRNAQQHYLQQKSLQIGWKVAGCLLTSQVRFLSCLLEVSFNTSQFSGSKCPPSLPIFSHSSMILILSSSPKQLCNHETLPSLQSPDRVYGAFLPIAKVGHSLPPSSWSGTKPPVSCACQHEARVCSALPPLDWSGFHNDKGNKANE